MALFVLLSVVAIHAQVARPETETSASNPRVTSVDGDMAIGKTITVTVDHLSTWADGREPSKLVPYVNGLEMKGL